MHPSVATASIALAPYSSTPINLSLTSSTTISYRPLHCLECGKKFLERDGDSFWRVGDIDNPRQAHVDAGGTILSVCRNCSQKYVITISLMITRERNGVPLYMQMQSIYFKPELDKHTRYTRCLECGKAFQTISDRISQVVDNAIPLEYLDPTKLAPLESICSFNRCRQRWALMV
jgi:DNA-directed RNA polymerase subunit RPC12/RpoP